MYFCPKSDIMEKLYNFKLFTGVLLYVSFILPQYPKVFRRGESTNLLGSAIWNIFFTNRLSHKGNMKHF